MNFIKSTLTWLSGKKTYIIAFAGAIYVTGISVGLWPHILWLDGVLGASGVAALRAGVEKSAPPSNG
jgi:hypothetical protein